MRDTAAQVIISSGSFSTSYNFDCSSELAVLTGSTNSLATGTVDLNWMEPVTSITLMLLNTCDGSYALYQGIAEILFWALPMPPPPPPAPPQPPLPCISSSHRFYPTSTATLTASVVDMGSSAPWSATVVGGITPVNITGSAGLPAWAGAYAYALTGSNSINFGTQTFGGTFSIATLSRKRATPVGNNPVYDFAATSDGLTMFYQPSGLGAVFGYYDGRTYMSYISSTATVSSSTWQHDVLVFEHVVNNSTACMQAGGTGGMAECTLIYGYSNGQLMTPYGPDFYGGFAGRNPVIKGLVGGQYGAMPITARSGLYLGASNWPQSGFNGDVADFQFFQDMALSAQNVSDLYAGRIVVC